MSSKTIANLLQHEPLYRKVEIDKHFYHPERVNGTKFQFYCPNDKAIQTFSLKIAPEKVFGVIDRLSSQEDDFYNPFTNTDKNSIDSIQYYVGECQYCGKFHVHFLLQIISEGEIHSILIEPQLFFSTAESQAYKKNLVDKSKLYMRKLGQWPGFQIKPNSTLYNFLDKEDQDYYNKALVCLSQNFGVAAFAYLRKIVEKEIIHIIEELTNEESTQSESIKAFLKEYYSKKQLSVLIENIFPHLPDSLKVLGDNPLKLLYGYLSEGLHNHNDEECLNYAIALDKLLLFTIKKLREDQRELREIKEVMKNLRSTNSTPDEK